MFRRLLLVENFILRRQTGNYYIFLLLWDKRAGKLIILRHIIKFHNLGASRQCKNNWKELNPFPLKVYVGPLSCCMFTHLFVTSTAEQWTGWTAKKGLMLRLKT